MAANYALADRPRLPSNDRARERDLAAFADQATYRAAVCGILIVFLAGLTLERSGPRLFLGGIMAGAVWLLANGRVWLAKSKRLSSYSAEWEIAVNVIVVTVAGSIVAGFDLSVVSPMIVIPSSKGRVAAAFVVLSAALFVGAGGTRIVRGVLDKVHALPPVSKTDGVSYTHEGVDEPEYNRGKIIGKLERLLMLVILGMGEFEGLGFLIAAKGLIRARDFEDRDFAEYFIIGSLMSVLVAILVSLPLRTILIALWSR